MVGSTLKFTCSYGGLILPRYPDGKLRYNGGETRVLSVDHSISFSELMSKLGEMCGSPVILRCQLPNEDLDALVSIKSDEDLANVVEEYDRLAAAKNKSSSNIKIRAFLSAAKKKPSSPTSSASTSSSNDSTSPKSPLSTSAVACGRPPRCPTSAGGRCTINASRPPVYAVMDEKTAGNVPQKYAYHYHHCQGNGGHVYLIHNGNHWQ